MGRTSSASSLPDDLRRDQALRLQAFHVAAAGLWTLALAMEAVVPSPDAGPHRNGFLLAGGAAASMVALYLRYARASLRARIDVGLAAVVLHALLVGVLNSWAHGPTARTLSPNVVLILLFGLLAPASPARVLVVGLVSASMDPIGVWVAHLRGLLVPDPLTASLLFYPNFVCAGLAIAPTKLLYRLGRELRAARAMGSYTLVERIGAGGMGEVWLARHYLLATPAAVKLIRTDRLGAGGGDNTQLRSRFEREARATASLTSPYTVRLFDYGVAADGTFYYVMEYLRGQDLETLVRRSGPLPVPRVVHVLHQLCLSLAEAHRAGLVHRDVKPANIYLCRLGLDLDVVKVLDFGLVRRDPGVSADTLLTGGPLIVGTPAYMAPEAAGSPDGVDCRADVYAVGCVAYFLLTGVRVFDGTTPVQVLLQHATERPVPPSQRVEHAVPAELDALVMACLEKDPSRRPESAGALVDQLESMPASLRHAWTRREASRWWDAHAPNLTPSQKGAAL